MIITLSGKIVGGSRLVINDNINVFLATQSNLWSNANNWSLGVIPSQNQTAIIRANCTVNTNFTVKNLTVEDTRTISFNAFTGTINNDFTCRGNLNQAGFASNLVLNGINNSVTGTFTSGTLSTIIYGRNGNQSVLTLAYNNLSALNTGIKSATGNLIVAGNFNISGSTLFANRFELNNYNLTVTGISNITRYLKENGSSKITFIGQVNITGFSTVDFRSGNPEIEFKGGISGDTSAVHLGTGLIKFTGNQTANLAFKQLYIQGPVQVTGILTVISSEPFTGIINFNAGIVGTTSNSKLIIGNFTTISFTNLLSMDMSNILFDYLTNESIVIFENTINVISPYTTFKTLKVLTSNNVTFNSNVLVQNNFSRDRNTTGIIDLLTNNLTVLGTSTDVRFINKSTTGDIIFTGAVSFLNGSMGTYPNLVNIILKNGYFDDSTLSFNNTNVIANTNNQIFNQSQGYSSRSFNIITIDNINLTLTGIGLITVNNSINGTTSFSKLIMNGNTFSYKGNNAPMLTGELQCNNVANTFKYNKSGNQDVKGGTYRTIEFGGSGVKTLLGNVIINVTAGGSQSTTGTATINLNGFTITTI